jgi:Myb-like DNA-binding protein FlbD
MNEKQTIHTRHRFTEEEDNLIRKLVEVDKLPSWDEVAKFVAGRTGRQCRDRYNGYLFGNQYNVVTKNKRFTEAEDDLLIEKYKEFGPRWVKISEFIPGRTGCQLKNRWHKELRNRTNVEYTLTKQERRSKRKKYDMSDEKSASKSEYSVTSEDIFSISSIIEENSSIFNEDQNFSIFISELYNSVL